MKIRTIRACSIFLLLSLLPAFAAEPSRAAESGRHCLWKVEGRRSTVYLLGSIHVLKAADYPLAAAIEAAFTNCAVAAFETDIAALEKPEVQMKILGRAGLPEGETLQQQLSPATYTLFTNQLAGTGMPLDVFAHLKPSIAVMTLAALEMQKLGLEPERGVDKHFFALARKQGKKIVPLETVDFQISLVTDFTKEESELLVKTTLADLNETKKEFVEMVKAWQVGDGDQLEKMLNDASREAPVIFKRLVTDRSQRWVPKIEEWLGGDKNVIMIVGAGHLVGKGGVVELLRNKGLKVTQQ